MTPARAIELTLAAEADIADILDRSAEDFGPGARRRYETLIAVALEDLRNDPVRPAAAIGRNWASTRAAIPPS